jgi:hypothetical protein
MEAMTAKVTNGCSQILKEFADREIGWDRDVEVDMVFGDCSSDDFYVMVFTDLTDKIASSNADVANEYGIAVFSDPNDVVSTIVGGVTGFTVVGIHIPFILPRTQGVSS